MPKSGAPDYNKIVWLEPAIQSKHQYLGSGQLKKQVSSMCSKLEPTIHLIPKWQPVYYSFVYMVISPLCLVNMYKIQKNFKVKVRQRGLINMQTKE